MILPPHSLFSVRDVINTFKHCKMKASPGPDNIGSRLLIHCADQLGPIFHHIFNLSLSQKRVLTLWKRSTIISIAKKLFVTFFVNQLDPRARSCMMSRETMENDGNLQLLQWLMGSSCSQSAINKQGECSRTDLSLQGKHLSVFCQLLWSLCVLVV